MEPSLPEPRPPESSGAIRSLLPGLAVAGITFAVFLPALRCGFVNWDDFMYVVENLHIRSLDLPFFRWAFTKQVVGHWQPLTNLTYAVDYAMWGLDPFGYHLTSILLHALNTLLVYALVFKLAEPLVRGNPAITNPRRSLALLAGVTALLFGVHPTRVESVVWISERKDLVYAFFFLLSALLYVEYCRSGPRRRLLYGLSLFAFALSIMGKSMAVTLPVVLMVLDAWPLRRFTSLKACLVEKWPFLALSASGAIGAVLSQSTGGAMRTLETHPLSWRVYSFVHSFPFYLYKTLIPTNLAQLYPYPKDLALLSSEFMLWVAVIAIVTVACLKLRAKTPLPLVAWGLFVVMLLPVTGVLQAGIQLAADRYTYLTTVGVFALVGAGAEVASRKRVWAFGAVVVATAAVIVLLSCATAAQSRLWTEPIVFWSHQIRLCPVYTAYSNRAYVYKDLGRIPEAIADFEAAAMLEPTASGPQLALGTIYYDAGQYDLAIQSLTRYIQLDPLERKGYLQRGNAQLCAGNMVDAVGDYTKCLRCDPRDPAVYRYRGKAFAAMGNVDGALWDYSKAIELGPAEVGDYEARGRLYDEHGELPKAIEDFTRVIELRPWDAAGYNNRGNAYTRSGLLDRAVADYETAIHLEPDDPNPQFNLALVCAMTGNRGRELACMKRAAELGHERARTLLAERFGEAAGGPGPGDLDPERAALARLREGWRALGRMQESPVHLDAIALATWIGAVPKGADIETSLGRILDAEGGLRERCTGPQAKGLVEVAIRSARAEVAKGGAVSGPAADLALLEKVDRVLSSRQPR